MTEQVPAAPLPLDPDLDPDPDIPTGAHRPAAATGPGPFQGDVRRGRWPGLRWSALAVVFAGGTFGGLARYAVSLAWPTPAYRFPWATFTVNTTGAFGLALLIYIVAEVWSPHRYARQLLGTGFLGAFTTFSSVVLSADQLAAHGHGRTAAIYLVGSLLAAAGAGSFGLLLGRAITASRHGEDETARQGRR